MMTKNVTVAIPVSVHRNTCVWAAQHGTSLSAVVAYLLSNLDVQFKARRQYDAQNPPRPVEARQPRLEESQNL